MSKKNQTSDSKPKGREIILKAKWCIKGQKLIVTVWANDEEHSAFIAPLEQLKGNKEFEKIIEKLFGRDRKWMTE